MTIRRVAWLPAWILVFFIGACSSSAPEPVPGYHGFSHADQLRAYLWGKDGRSRLISAHRGGPGPGLPENALETFAHSLKLAPCIIECDVRMSRDGILVLMHDATLERTTNGTGAVAKKDLAHLRRLRLRDPSGRLTAHGIPTLGETLEWARQRCVLTLDVKEHHLYPMVLDSLARHRARGYAVVITYSHEQAGRVNVLDPEVVISASAASVSSLQRLLNTGVPAARLVVFVGTREPDPQVYRMLRASGVPAILGTMNHLDRQARRRGDVVYRELYLGGAQILSTDSVRRVARCLKETGRGSAVFH